MYWLGWNTHQTKIENQALIFSNTAKLSHYSPLLFVNYFEYWLLSKFSHLIARQNKSRPGGEIFRICTQRNNIFFLVKRENNGKAISIWTAPNADLKICLYLRLHMNKICRIFHIITPFTFWDMHLWDVWNVCLQTFRYNRIC